MIIRELLTKWLSHVILRKASEIEKEAFRKLENIKKKLNVTEQHRNFNLQCIQHDLLPVYTNNIRLHDADASAQGFVQRFRKDLIERQIKQQNKSISQQKLSLKAAIDTMSGVAGSSLRFDAFMKMSSS